jgi:4-amino-4-deoxychorismate lyase
MTLELVMAENLDYGYKYLDRSALNNLKAKSQADDIIIVQDGFVTDTSIANLVFENDRGFFTPQKHLLPGIKRESLLAAGVIKLKNISAADLKDYTRVRLINAMIDLEDNLGANIEDINMTILRG